MEDCLVDLFTDEKRGLARVHKQRQGMLEKLSLVQSESIGLQKLRDRFLQGVGHRVHSTGSIFNAGRTLPVFDSR